MEKKPRKPRTKPETKTKPRLHAIDAPRIPARSGGYLHPFQKGNQYAKNHGRPKGLTNIKSKLRYFGSLEIEGSLRAKLKKQYPGINFEGMTVDDMTWFNLRRSALAGSSFAIQFLAERVEGKVQSSVDVTTKGKEVKQSIYNVIDLKQKADLETLHSTADDI